MSDVYSFGVVLLELLTRRKFVDKSRPHREQNLAEWARPMLNDSKKLSRVMDPRLEGQHSESRARKAAMLAYQCLSHRPKTRPTMSTVVKTLEPLKDFDDIPIGPFVYTVPMEIDSLQKEGKRKELKKRNGHRHHNHQLHQGHRHNHRHHHQDVRPPTKSPSHSDSALRHNNHTNGLNSPLRSC